MLDELDDIKNIDYTSVSVLDLNGVLTILGYKKSESKSVITTIDTDGVKNSYSYDLEYPSNFITQNLSDKEILF